MNLENIMLSEVREIQNKYCMIPLIRNIWSAQIHSNRKEFRDRQGSGEGRVGSYYLMSIDFLFGVDIKLS